MKTYPYVIIGGGIAAGYAAQVFAEADLPAEQVAIFSAEHLPPYERPPLSKGFLAGEKSAEETLINDPDFYTENGIKLYLETPVKAVDFSAHTLTTEKGEFGFERLLITLGSHLKKLNIRGSDLAGIHYLRKLPDSRTIRKEIEAAAEAVVIGGSFIAMEVAAVMAQADVNTTMVFPESRVWEAFFTPKMSAFFTNYYEERGVQIMPGKELSSFEGEDGRIHSVKLKSGESLPADMVVAGVGVEPNVALFRASPLEVRTGILVNRFLETNVPGVWAAGDIAEYRDVIYEKTRHIEHWDNAYAQGQHAAHAMLGEQEVFEHVPYFFSDVFDLSYEFWGDTSRADQVVHRGDVHNGRFSAWWLKEDQLHAAFVLNRPDEEREVAPKWIKSGQTMNVERLRDEEQPLTDATEKTSA